MLMILGIRSAEWDCMRPGRRSTRMLRAQRGASRAVVDDSKSKDPASNLMLSCYGNVVGKVTGAVYLVDPYHRYM